MKSDSDKKTVFICQGTGCISSGSPKITQAIKNEIRKLGIDDIQVKITGCHGFCQRGPVVVIEPEAIFYSEVTEEDVPEIVESHLKHGKPVEHLFYKDSVTGKPIPCYTDVPFYSKQDRLIILRNCGHINPEDIEDYITIGGYEALKKVLLNLTAENVIEEISRSGLRGRGGAGFPTGKKWKFCRDAPGTKKYMICNADEGDPGAFMDRSILEADPHSVIEGLIIAGYAIGADEGYIYVRAEYPLAVKRVRLALQQAEKKGFLGQNILDTNFSFKVNVMEGAGAFVCGEETALIASIEGKRGMPRARPPFPAISGLWSKPTTINNVKTLTSIPVIISKGAEWYSSIGTKECKGTAVFAITGNIANCGLVEVAMGTTLRDIIYEIGGGVPGGKSFKAVQTGGPSGGCLPESFLDHPVDYESLAAAGSIMGSGGMVVMDEDTCMVDIARYFLDFTQRESCGECVPCRLGTKQMLEILEDITNGNGRLEDIDLLVELAEAVKMGALCGLGQTAPNPVLTTIRYFRDEYESHIKYKRCPAVVCKEIISSPCQHVCPIGTQAPVYISLIAQGRFKEAFEIILRDNPLPAVCGRVCHHPCESKCQAGKWGDPITIRALKRFAADYALKTGIYPVTKEQKRSGEKVAIIGSGPAGLMAGYHLANKRYDVTIFEALDVPGGALAVCIPEYRLPNDILDLDITNIKNTGVKIKTNTRIGEDIPFDELLSNYKGVFIATGAHKSRKLHIPNEDADGVIDAMQFLKDVNLGQKVNIGKTVGIIGGGNAAVDAARTAIRIKACEKVLIIYRRTRAEMPAFKEEVDAAIEEGIEVQFLTAPTKIMTENGKVKGVECIKMELGEVDESGRRRPIPIENTEFFVNLDTLIAAIGEEPDLSFLGEKHSIEVSKRNRIAVCPETFATSVDKVFAGGDVVTGPNTVIDAMSSGKIVAEMIDKYIQGKSLAREDELTRPSMYLPPVELTEQEIEEAERPRISCLPVNKRINSFSEIDLNMTEEMAIKEARRCLRCDLETEDGKKAIEALEYKQAEGESNNG
ncbi:MAG: NADH-quinone oxidoreductase subunit NuoF [Planctomycetota bacterium]|jgi:NADH-quinone oxidoreductase subunit F